MTDTGIKLDIPPALIAAARNRSLSMFIGAGFTKNISRDIPDANQLIRIAARYAGIDERLLSIHTNDDYMLVAEYLEIEGVIQKAISELERVLHDKTYSVTASRPHIQLTEMECNTIFTTNWDWWIEKTFEYENVTHRVIRTPADLILPTPAPDPLLKGKLPHSTTIVKYHGDLSYYDTIVFSIRSYFDRIFERTPLDALLETEIFSKSFLFVGYSFSDPNLRLIWYKLLRQRQALSSGRAAVSFPPSFIIMNGINPISARWLTHLGIQVISVDPTPEKITASVEKVFDQIIGAQR